MLYPIEKVLFGLGKPDAELEERVGVRKTYTIKQYRDLELDLDGDKLELFSPEITVTGNKNVRKALIFLSNYTKTFNYNTALLTLEGLLQIANIETMKISPETLTINSSKILYWSYLTPAELASAITLAKHRKIIVLGDERPMRILYYIGDSEYIDKNGEKWKYHKGHTIRLKDSQEEKIGEYNIFKLKYGSIIIGKNINATANCNNPRCIKYIIQLSRENPGWILKDYTESQAKFERNAGPFKVIKIIYPGTKIKSYYVLSADGTKIFQTTSKKLGEKLNYKTIKEIIA